MTVRNFTSLTKLFRPSPPCYPYPHMNPKAAEGEIPKNIDLATARFVTKRLPCLVFCVVWHKTVVFCYRIFAYLWSNLIILSWLQVPDTSARLREHKEIYGSASRDCLHRTAIYCNFSSHMLSSTPMEGLHGAVCLVGSGGEFWEIKTTF